MRDTLVRVLRRLPWPDATARDGAADATHLTARKRIGRGEWIRSVTWAVVLFAVLRLFVVQVYGIRSGSMSSTLQVGDYVVANNTLFGAALPFTAARTPALREPRAGEVVVYRPAGYRPVQDHIKRIIGLPGDTVQMIRGTVHRNGRPLREPYAEAATEPDVPLAAEGPYNFQWQLDALPATVDREGYAPTRDSWGPLIVPTGRYLMLGDDRDNSVDTRHTGFVPREEIRGKVLAVHWSRGVDAVRWGRIGKRP
jgi:signal peptidase I